MYMDLWNSVWNIISSYLVATCKLFIVLLYATQHSRFPYVEVCLSSNLIESISFSAAAAYHDPSSILGCFMLEVVYHLSTYH